MIPSRSKRWGKLTRELLLALGLIGLTVAGEATAACLDGGKSPGTADPRLPDAASMVQAVYHPGQASGSFIRVNEEYRPEGSIVGLWQFKLNGFSVDWGTQAWHSDGTELMFSGNQNPETGDVCQGVWRKVGSSTYTLNHIAMAWTAPGAQFGTRVHFHMVVKLAASGDSFSGKYTAAVYSVGPTDPFDESVKVASGGGDVTATRVKPD